MAENTATPPSKPTRTRKETKVMVLGKIEAGDQEVIRIMPNTDDPPFEFDSKAAALRWIRDHGADGLTYLPIRALGDWQTLSVKTKEVRKLS